ncbi:MAG: 30S ribosomal protein S12 methylthiotransferase RimO [Bacteroidales bacterium]|nr:30S ribosomal protein S12 methylthiotransferase RimO [Bacteroidales bacterium]
MKTTSSKNKINIITLGCSKNLVDSEVLMGQLQAGKLEVVHDSNDTDARTVVINTCGFIHDAKEESINTILQFIQAKEAGKIDNVFVMGCLSERYKKDLEDEIGEVDQYFGVNDIKEIVTKLGIDYRKDLLGERLLTTPKHYAYLKISEGCDRTCSFCSIPLIRGKHISKPIEEILLEAQNLVNRGVKELILIAQDLSYYGLDLYKKRMLHDLLTRLTEIEGLSWIRLHYTYPTSFPVDILPLMASNDKICNYIDIPVQHISDLVLKNMRRAHDRKSTLDLLHKFREEVPSVAIRTTMLVGHPGEGEKEFDDLKDFVKKFRFDRLGVFPYSHEEGTYGYEHFTDEIPEEVKNQRVEELMQIQQKVSAELNQARLGKEFKVLIDRKEGEYYIGRTEYDSPEVDNEVLIRQESGPLSIGEFYQIKITDASEYDLFGELV